jgi:hypothetical protein
VESKKQKAKSEKQKAKGKRQKAKGRESSRLLLADLPTCRPAHLPTWPPAHLPTCPSAHPPAEISALGFCINTGDSFPEAEPIFGTFRRWDGNPERGSREKSVYRAEILYNIRHLQ